MSMLGLGQAFLGVEKAFDDADRQREIDRQRQLQAAQLALQQEQEARLQQAQQFERAMQIARQTPAGTVVTPEFRQRVGPDFAHIIAPEMGKTLPVTPFRGQEMTFPPEPGPNGIPTGREVWGGLQDARTAAMLEKAEADRYAQWARSVLGVDAGIYKANLGAETSKDVAETNAGARVEAAKIGANRPRAGAVPRPMTPAQVAEEKRKLLDQARKDAAIKFAGKLLRSSASNLERNRWQRLPPDQRATAQDVENLAQQLYQAALAERQDLQTPALASGHAPSAPAPIQAPAQAPNYDPQALFGPKR